MCEVVSSAASVQCRWIKASQDYRLVLVSLVAIPPMSSTFGRKWARLKYLVQVSRAVTCSEKAAFYVVLWIWDFVLLEKGKSNSALSCTVSLMTFPSICESLLLLVFLFLSSFIWKGQVWAIWVPGKSKTLNNHALNSHQSFSKNPVLFASLHVNLQCLILLLIFHSGLSDCKESCFVSRYWSKVSFSISPMQRESCELKIWFG